MWPLKNPYHGNRVEIGSKGLQSPLEIVGPRSLQRQHVLADRSPLVLLSPMQ